MRLTLRQLQYFVAAVNAGSITRAAAQLHVAATALSLQIKAIEDQFGVELLSRHSRGIALTALGAAFAEQARVILAQVSTTESLLQSGDGGMPRTIRIGAPPAVLRLIGTDAVIGAAGRFPGVNIEVFEGWSSELETRLRQGSLDVVVGYGLTSDEALYAVQLHDDAFYFVGAPTVVGPAAPISLTAALASDLVFYGTDSVGWRASCEAAQRAGLPLPREHHVGSIDVWRAMLCRGIACTIGSFAAVAEEYGRGELVLRPIVGHPIHRYIGISFRREDMDIRWPTDFTNYVRDLIQQAFSDLDLRSPFPVAPFLPAS